MENHEHAPHQQEVTWTLNISRAGLQPLGSVINLPLIRPQLDKPSEFTKIITPTPRWNTWAFFVPPFFSQAETWDRLSYGLTVC